MSMMVDRKTTMKNFVYDRLLKFRSEQNQNKMDDNFLVLLLDLLKIILWVCNEIEHEQMYEGTVLHQILIDEPHLIYCNTPTINDIVNISYIVTGGNVGIPILLNKIEATDNNTLSLIGNGGVFKYHYTQIFRFVKQNSIALGGLNKMLDDVLSICFDEWDY